MSSQSHTEPYNLNSYLVSAKCWEPAAPLSGYREKYWAKPTMNLNFTEAANHAFMEMRIYSQVCTAWIKSKTFWIRGLLTQCVRWYILVCLIKRFLDDKQPFKEASKRTFWWCWRTLAFFRKILQQYNHPSSIEMYWVWFFFLFPPSASGARESTRRMTASAFFPAN